MFCLKVQNYGDALNTILQDFSNYKDFSDVTLVCDDQTQFPAHKVVLSACSPLFAEILLNHPHSHPLIYMSGVNKQVIQSIIQLMYLGKAIISQKTKSEFMKVAMDLEIESVKHNGILTVDEYNENNFDNFIFVDENIAAAGLKDESFEGSKSRVEQEHKCNSCDLVFI